MIKGFIRSGSFNADKEYAIYKIEIHPHIEVNAYARIKDFTKKWGGMELNILTNDEWVIAVLEKAPLKHPQWEDVHGTIDYRIIGLRSLPDKPVAREQYAWSQYRYDAMRMELGWDSNEPKYHMITNCWWINPRHDPEYKRMQEMSKKKILRMRG